MVAGRAAVMAPSKVVSKDELWAVRMVGEKVPHWAAQRDSQSVQKRAARRAQQTVVQKVCTWAGWLVRRWGAIMVDRWVEPMVFGSVASRAGMKALQWADKLAELMVAMMAAELDACSVQHWVV